MSYSFSSSLKRSSTASLAKAQTLDSSTIVLVDNPLTTKEAKMNNLKHLYSNKQGSGINKNSNKSLELQTTTTRLSDIPSTTTNTTTPSLPVPLKTRESSWNSKSKRDSLPSSFQQTTILTTATSSEYKDIKLALFWRCFCFCLQALMLVISIKKCFFSTPEAFWYTAFLEKLLEPFIALNTLNIVASNPFSVYKVFEIISIIMLLLTRCSGLLSTESNYDKTEIDTNPGFNPGMIEVGVFIYFFCMILRYDKLLIK